MRTTAEVVDRLLRDAGSDGARWTSLLARLPMLPPEQYQAVIDALEGLASTALDDENRSEIWDALRDLVGRHRAFRTAKWAMKPERVSRLEEILDLFAPMDLVALYTWLFDYRPRPQDGKGVFDTSYETQQEEVDQRRVEAIEAIVSRSGLNGIKDLARTAKAPVYVGRAAADADGASRFADQILSCHLADAEPALADLARGYVAGRAIRSDEWIPKQLRRPELELSSEQEAVLLGAMPATTATWRMAAKCGLATSLTYWRDLPIPFVRPEHVLEAVRELLAAGRPFAAVELLGIHLDKHPAPAELIAHLLDAAASDTCEHDRPTQHFAYFAGILLDSLADAAFDEAEIGRLEWRLLPVVDRYTRPPEALNHLLCDDPELFTQVLASAYHSAETRPSASRNRSTSNWR